MTRFSEIKVGDTITAKYLRQRRRAPEARRREVGGQCGGRGDEEERSEEPGATGATQHTITATITEIDPKVPSITFFGPNNWTYSSRVEDKKALATVKVGDKVDITWTAAMLVSFQ